MISEEVSISSETKPRAHTAEGISRSREGCEFELLFPMLHLLDLRGEALFRDRRRPLPVIGLAISLKGASAPSDSVTNRSISHRPAGPGGVSILWTACMVYSPHRQSGRFC